MPGTPRRRDAGRPRRDRQRSSGAMRWRTRRSLGGTHRGSLEGHCGPPGETPSPGKVVHHGSRWDGLLDTGLCRRDVHCSQGGMACRMPALPRGTHHSSGGTCSLESSSFSSPRERGLGSMVARDRCSAPKPERGWLRRGISRSRGSWLGDITSGTMTLPLIQWHHFQYDGMLFMGWRKELVAVQCSIPSSPRLDACHGLMRARNDGFAHLWKQQETTYRVWTRTWLHKVGLTERSSHLPHPQVTGVGASVGESRIRPLPSTSCRPCICLTFVSKTHGGQQPPKLANKILAPSGTVLFISLRWLGITSALREINGPIQHRPHQTSVPTAARSPAHKPSEKTVISLCGSQLKGSQRKRVWDTLPPLGGKVGKQF